MLINVTIFFRDSRVFQAITERIIPELVASQQPDRPIRVWLAGCSTGEDVYSLVMLFQEYVGISSGRRELQIFASDLDADAIATACDGLYPNSIAHDVSAPRLARFFSKEGNFYRVLPEIRSMIVFNVQDVPGDPPFTHLDLVLYRNLPTDLLPIVQERVVDVFHRALRNNGILVLGNAGSVNERDDRFIMLDKSALMYRHVGASDQQFGIGSRNERSVSRSPECLADSRKFKMEELCGRLVMENHVPAAILINSKNECLFSLGPIGRFVHVAPGYPTHDLFAMVLPAMQNRLRKALQVANDSNGRVIVDGVVELDGSICNYRIDVLPVLHAGEALFLICFPSEHLMGLAAVRSPKLLLTHADMALEQELDIRRADLQVASHDLQRLTDAQSAVNDEADLLHEAPQSSNEALLVAKEKLQSTKNEISALNTQLYEARARQRVTSDDLQNVLLITNVASIFLDANLCIRLFTPATKALFNVIQTDIGRPLSDLEALSFDSTLLSDASIILTDHTTIEREVEAPNNVSYFRRSTPYLTDGGAVGGVVVTFVDSKERHLGAEALQAARGDIEQASVARFRFLAAGSHDLRQPLQALSLMRDVLSQKIRDGKTTEALELLARVDETTTKMSSMLDSLLDITGIDSGNIQPHLSDFPIGELLQQLAHEFGAVATAQGLELRVVQSAEVVCSNRHMLGEMVRNLLANALKYTPQGKVLLGCRHRGDCLSIEVWDTGIGITDDELVAIFDEYDQADASAPKPTRGLGLSNVQRLGKLLGHEVRVRSIRGKGSVFSIDIQLHARKQTLQQGNPPRTDADDVGLLPQAGVILVVEDDAEVLELLNLMLREEGHQVTVAADGEEALALVGQGLMSPDLLLIGLNLRNGINGLSLAEQLRVKLRRTIPIVILTDDISTGTMLKISAQNCIRFNKPIVVGALMRVIHGMLPKARLSLPSGNISAAPGTIYVIDDDPGICDAMRLVLMDVGHKVQTFPSAEAFLAEYPLDQIACLVVDAKLPGISGLELLEKINIDGHRTPAIMITGHSDVAMVVAAMQAGAFDFIEKPVGRDELLAGVDRALELARHNRKLVSHQQTAAARLDLLTARQREIMTMMLAGRPNKNIAADINISQRTVENHRAEILKRTGVKSLLALLRLVIAAVPPQTRQIRESAHNKL
ncbi:MAG: response regulator [Acetobacteraceae bacterium]|nr:response regulator [Acetobacteraceae bacterium]